MNLPIFRAKRIDSDEYVVGYIKNCTDTGINIFWIQTKEWIDYRIDPSTLAIHFPNMLDSEENKIFASLQEDGKGGDIITCEDYGLNQYTVIYNKDTYEFGIQRYKTDEWCWEYSPIKEESLGLLKTIGIQQ